LRGWIRLGQVEGKKAAKAAFLTKIGGVWLTKLFVDSQD
jgi:hypothetical protein